MSSTPIYTIKIMQIAGRMPAMERLNKPDAKARRVSNVCGSVIEVEIAQKGGFISEYYHEINACILGQAAASIVANNIIGRSAKEMRQLQLEMAAMLKRDGDAPKGTWAELSNLLAVRDFAPRHASTMLVFDALVDCLDASEGKQARAVSK